jgi:hypothetical protein
MNKKNYLYKIWKEGFKLGWKTLYLPEHILKLQKNPFIELFKILSGVSTILILTKTSSVFPSFFLYIFLFLIFIFFVYYIYILYHIIKYMYRFIKIYEKIHTEYRKKDQI